MDCPGCGRSGLVNLSVEDSFVCDCGRKITLGYYVCNGCGFAFRLQNGKYVDGYYVDNDVVSQVCDDLSIKIDVEDSESISDYVQKCVRCEEAFIAEPGTNRFGCPYCGFEWEVIKND